MVPNNDCNKIDDISFWHIENISGHFQQCTAIILLKITQCYQLKMNSLEQGINLKFFVKLTKSLRQTCVNLKKICDWNEKLKESREEEVSDDT